MQKSTLIRIRTMALISSVFACVICCNILPSFAQTLMPTSGWLVGPSSLASDANNQAPCIMTNSFANGSMLRISGGNQKIMGLAISLNKELFAPHKSFDVYIRIDNNFEQMIQATSFDSATLMMNVQSLDGLYAALKSAKLMSLSFAGYEFEYVMLGADEGLARIEQCINPSNTQPRRNQNDNGISYGLRNQTPPATPLPMQQAQQAQLNVNPTSNVASVAQAYQALENLDISKEATLPELPLGKKSNKSSSVQASDTKNNPNATRLSNILAQAGRGPNAVPLTAVADNVEPAPVQAQNASANHGLGLATEASSPAVNSQQSVISGQVPTPARSMPHMGDNPVSLGNIFANRAPKGARQMNVTNEKETDFGIEAGPKTLHDTSSWRAESGADLRQVIENWAKFSGVIVEWRTEHSYLLPYSITVQGTFDAAILAALRQFEGAVAVPLGQIYTNKATNQRHLIITSKQ
jgi:hypothetical protein